MKKICCLTAALVCFGSLHVSAAPQIPPRYFVVCITEMDKTEELQVMSADEFKQVSDEVKAETALFPRAVENARSEWMKDETLRKKIFPKSALFPRKVEAKGPPFTDQDKALKRVENMSDAQKKNDERKQEQQKQREKARGRSDDIDKREKEKKDDLLKATDLVRAELEKLKSTGAGKPASRPAGGKPE